MNKLVNDFRTFLTRKVDESITEEFKKEYKLLNSSYPYNFPFTEKLMHDGRKETFVYALSPTLPDTKEVMSDELYSFYISILKTAIMEYYNEIPDPYKPYLL